MVIAVVGQSVRSPGLQRSLADLVERVAAQGPEPLSQTPRQAHAAVVEIVKLWLETAPTPGPRLVRSFSGSRKARHEDEYASPQALERTDRELEAPVLDIAQAVNRLRQASSSAIPGNVPADATPDQHPER